MILDALVFDPTRLSFRSALEYEIEYECEFRISNELRSQSRRFSLLLISRGGGSRDNIVVLCNDLEYEL